MGKEVPSTEKAVEEDSPVPVKIILKARNIKINGKDHLKYLVRLKNQEEYKESCLPEYNRADGQIHLRSMEDLHL
ncbi:hypothetical protein O181_004725 [Austropuccinia psidii MF-1]|uniref:Uncharacterized protein n=1 Tax=Austropuccinia psidii MF-1 TaxID=1389203 RepID=A0A9Q3GF45_9BASI|nr:hypothetical protein [Austropuccinia psidii MF-1]